ncbi:MAG TPA: DUF3533 domain-containing protein [Streptosporangiaceae bacterium]|nr:DUF3533 domain-containing protein [Streptosporangiaceae bacterium]
MDEIAFPVRAGHVLKARSVWIVPTVLGAILVVLIAVFYIGSVIDPLAHLHGLPVGLVNRDRGAVVGRQRISIGERVQHGLSSSPAVASRLSLTASTLGAAEQTMDRDGLYATVVIPPNFSASLFGLAGVPAGAGAGRPEVVILTNQRAGVEGTSLATGVLQPALAAASRQIGSQLTALVPTRATTPVSRAFLADPITVVTVPYRPLPSHSALGLSDFYIALLILMCGFLAGTIVNSAVDAALGYATTEIGPRWRQRQPVPINRWQTLIVKWVMAAVLTAVMTALVVLVAVVMLGMDAPHTWLLWLLAWLAAASVAAGTLMLLAVVGAFGQLIALIVFVYAGLASAGGTVPLQALPGYLRWLAEIEPLRQILSGTRAILYFNAQAAAGLTRAFVAAAAGLVFSLVVAGLVVRWYDRKGFYRINPRTLAYVRGAVAGYEARPSADSPPTTGSEGNHGESPR